jgi:hypothetical protein
MESTTDTGAEVQEILEPGQPGEELVPEPAAAPDDAADSEDGTGE